MSWSDGGCARVHNPGKRWDVAKTGDGVHTRADQASRMRKPIGFRRHLSRGRAANVWAPGELLQQGDGATLAELVGATIRVDRLVAQRGSSLAAFGRKVGASQSYKVSGCGSGSGLARLVLHTRKRRQGDIESRRERYIEEPGRPILLDGSSKSESSVALANFRRARFQRSIKSPCDANAPTRTAIAISFICYRT